MFEKMTTGKMTKVKIIITISLIAVFLVAIFFVFQKYIGGSSGKSDSNNKTAVDPKPQEDTCEGRKPTAKFKLSLQQIFVGESLTIQNESETKDQNYTWKWEFQEGDPPDSDIKEPPQVKYLKDGTFPIKLTITDNACNNHSDTISGFITVKKKNVEKPPPDKNGTKNPPSSTPSINFPDTLNKRAKLTISDSKLKFELIDNQNDISKFISITFLKIDPPLSDGAITLNESMNIYDEKIKEKSFRVEFSGTEDTKAKENIQIAINCLINDVVRVIKIEFTSKDQISLPNAEMCGKK